MALSDLISSMNQDGFWQGMQDYVGNDTGLGQTINGVNNMMQPNGQPKQQLIGNPQAITPDQASSINPAMTPTMPVKPEINAMIKAHATNSQGPQQPDLSQLFLQPTSVQTPNQSQAQPAAQSNSSKGTGRDLVAAAALL